MLGKELYIVNFEQSQFYFEADPEEFDRLRFYQNLDKFNGMTARHSEADVFKQIVDMCREHGCSIRVVHPVEEFYVY